MKSDASAQRKPSPITPSATKPSHAPQPGAPMPPMPASGANAFAASILPGAPAGVASSAAAILRAIQNASRGRNGGSPSEHREATRYHYCVPMTLHIDDPRRAGTRIIRAASSNISNGGFAFIFDAALNTGSIIRAQFDSLPGKPQIAGIVRSCVHICGTQHRIGVEYQ